MYLWAGLLPAPREPVGPLVLTNSHTPSRVIAGLR